MYTPQAGIFALGTSSHAYLEFDLVEAERRKEFVASLAAIHEPRTTTGGVNFVIGFRPELWRDLVPSDAPEDVEGSTKPFWAWKASSCQALSTMRWYGCPAVLMT